MWFASVETCELTGGAIVDPVVRDHAIGDHEDNHILALAKDPAVDADVIVSSDHHLIDLGPAWNGRLMVRPRPLTSHMVRSGLQSAPAPAPEVSRAPAKVQPAPKRGGNPFPELRGVQLDRYGLSEAAVPQHDDDLQR